MANEPSSNPPRTLAKSTAENVKDNLESIVVAFILAFVFRAFVVEAFVIPTGSMAPTLYGNQVTTTCSTCGFEYARGIDQNEQKYAERSTRSITLHCPNCETLLDTIEQRDIINPGSGDRILVYKWPLDTGIERLGPKRWEVTVFKDPFDGTTNFIKRLVGLPGEVLEIIDGDVYRASFEDLEKAGFPFAEMDRLRKQIYAVGQGQDLDRAEIEAEYRRLNELILPHLKIQRKLLQMPRAQEALWMNIYNHDYLPNYSALGGETERARDERGVGWYADNPTGPGVWNTKQREITCNSNSPEPSYIHFGGKRINNFSGYNAEPPAFAPVGDVRLSFVWLPDAGSGSLFLQLNRDQDTFVAEIRMDGTVTVTGKQPKVPGGEQIIGTRKLEPFEPGKAVKIEYVNVDYLVRLCIGDEIVMESTEAQYAPDPVAALKGNRHAPFVETRVRIGASNLVCRLHHVRLERDVYYTNERLRVEDPPKPKNPYDGWAGWGTAGHPIMLRPKRVVNGVELPGEYFMLGDNSPQSKDSRLWWEIGPHLLHLGEEYQVGTATSDQLIGKAFFVYWPAAYRRSWAPSFGFIPNVGQMRWIR